MIFVVFYQGLGLDWLLPDLNSLLILSLNLPFWTYATHRVGKCFLSVSNVNCQLYFQEDDLILSTVVEFVVPLLVLFVVIGCLFLIHIIYMYISHIFVLKLPDMQLSTIRGGSWGRSSRTSITCGIFLAAMFLFIYNNEQMQLCFYESWLWQTHMTSLLLVLPCHSL